MGRTDTREGEEMNEERGCKAVGDGRVGRERGEGVVGGVKYKSLDQSRVELDPELDWVLILDGLS